MKIMSPLCLLGLSLAAAASFAVPSAERGERPETWFHVIGGNASKAGLTADDIINTLPLEELMKNRPAPLPLTRVY